MTATTHSLPEINAMPGAEFVATLGGVFEPEACGEAEVVPHVVFWR